MVTGRRWGTAARFHISASIARQVVSARLNAIASRLDGLVDGSCRFGARAIHWLRELVG